MYSWLADFRTVVHRPRPQPIPSPHDLAATHRGRTLAPVPPEVAVGFRVSIGQEQWIIYRSLARLGNRTLLGHNLATESLIARFGKDGEVTSIVEIE